MSRRLCLVTGASAGIGAAFARVYAANDWDVALTARRGDRLEALAQDLTAAHGVEALTIAADLADPAAPAAIVERIHASGRDIDGLVNNAGYGLRGAFTSTAWEEQARFLQIMLQAPTELCHRVLPGMRARGFGRIINIASVMGHMNATAGSTLYGPVKHFLVRLAEGLHMENKPHGVHVTAVSPGFTLSEFHDVNGMREKVSSSLPSWAWQTADQVAKQGYAACEAGAAIRVTGALNKLAVGVNKLMPDPIGRAMVAKQASRFRDSS